jgi:hypothetical protein
MANLPIQQKFPNKFPNLDFFDNPAWDFDDYESMPCNSVAHSMIDLWDKVVVVL